MIERIEHDTMGAVRVPADRLWGAQTERSRRNFHIGEERMPLALVYGLVAGVVGKRTRVGSGRVTSFSTSTRLPTQS